MSYIKYNRDTKTDEWLMKKRPTAFVLLCLIAKRAKRSNNHPDKTLEIGEAEIGDYENYGVTQQIYRSDKKFLEINGQVTIRTTNKGTIARLVNTDIFDINEEELTSKLTRNQRATNEQLTTNNNVKNVKEVKKLTEKELFEISKHFKVSYLDVLEKHKAVWESIENGDKYKVRSVRGTVSNWVRMGIDKGQIEQLDDLGMKIDAQYYDPEYRAKVEKFKLKVQEMKKMENQSLTSTSLKKNNSYAQRYLEIGWSVLPMKFIEGKDGKMVKKPVIKWKDFQTERATPDTVKYWIDNGFFLGVITGKLSGIVIVDDDRVKHGLNPSTITSTVMARTKSGGTHIYYRYDREIRNVANPNLFIDIRGEGGYCVLPPYNGYEWISPPTKENLENLPVLPENIEKEIIGDRQSFSGKIVRGLSGNQEWGRNDTMLKLACSIWNNDKMTTNEKIDQITWLNDTRCQDEKGNPNPLPQEELEVIITQARNFVESHPKEKAEVNEPVLPPKKLQSVIDERSEERKLEVDCPSTGFDTLDRMVKGFVPKHTYVLTGDTNVGKTSLACSFACNVALQGKKVLYLALEPDTGVVEYFASIINNKRFDELDPLMDYNFGNLPIDVYTSMEINSVDKLIKALDDTERYDLIIIDHIGYFVTDKSNTNQEQSNVMKKLAGIAKQKQTSVMAIAHIRKPDNRVKQKVPTMNDISGSGSFKQDGTDVWIVYKKPNLDDETHSTYLNEGCLIVAKSKSGRTGPINIIFSNMKAGIREFEEFE